MPRVRKSYRDEFLHVCATQCATCIFRSGNLMRLLPGRVSGMVKEATARGGIIPCHDTLGGLQSVCRGFYNLRFSHPHQGLQLAERLGRIKFTEHDA